MNGDAHSAANGVGSSAQEPRIAIVGAGLTGLATAQGLRKIGIQATVFERDTDINARPRDWSILLHWAMPILENMVPEDIRQKLSSATCNPHLDFTSEGRETPAYNGLTGNVLFTVPHVGARRISRQAMRRVLAEGIDIKWGRNLELLTATESCIRLTFGDDDVFDADFVIGADGVSSKVRELLLGVEAAQARMAGLTIATTLVRYGDVEKIAFLNEFHPVATIAFIPNGVTGFGVLSAPDPNDMLSWTMFWAKIWKGSVTLQGQEALDYVKKNTQGVCEPFQSAINWTPDGSHCYADEMKYWVPVPWNNHSGRVTIIGDAAHPMLPYRGQGLQHAITDASNYVNVMAAMINKQNDAMSREKIMTDFDTEMIDRGAKAVAQAISEAELSLDLKTVEDMIMARQGLAKTA